MDDGSYYYCILFNDGHVLHLSTAVEQAVACAPVTQRAQVRFPVGTGFLGEVFSVFFLTCKTNVRKPQAHKSSNIIWPP